MYCLIIQIAEHPQFTAINSFKGKLDHYENAYRINDDIAVYLKYASKPTERFGKYRFNFNTAHLDELDAISKAVPKTFLALVCVEARQVCCLPYSQLLSLIQRRRTRAGHAESQYVILVTAPKNKTLHVYIDVPHKKKMKLGKDIIVNRNAFPNDLFQ